MLIHVVEGLRCQPSDGLGLLARQHNRHAASRVSMRPNPAIAWQRSISMRQKEKSLKPAYPAASGRQARKRAASAGIVTWREAADGGDARGFQGIAIAALGEEQQRGTAVGLQVAGVPGQARNQDDRLPGRAVATLTSEA
jgi:hypothetical protein